MNRLSRANRVARGRPAQKINDVVQERPMGTAAYVSGAPQAGQIRVMVVRSVTGAGGGADKIILRTAKQACQRGLQMTLCAIYGYRDSAFDLPERAARFGAKVIGVAQRWPGDPRVFRLLKEVAQAGKFDVIHSHDYKATYYALKLGRLCNLPVAATAHGWTGDLLRERRFYYPLDKRLLRKCQAVIAVSSEIRKELVRCQVPAGKLRVILNGVDAYEYQRNEVIRLDVRRELSIGDEEIVIGAVGRVEKQKRFDLLIDAFAQLAPQRKSLRVLVAGAGTLLDLLRDRVHRRRLENRCQLLGHRSDMHRLYQAFDLYVQSSEYEGTPTVVVEAMAMRIPIVATDVGGTTELVYPDEHALVVPPHDVNALAKAIEATLDDPEATNRRVARSRQRTECELSIDHRTEQLMEAYRHVIAEYRRAQPSLLVN